MSLTLWLSLYSKNSNWGLKDGDYEICCECGEILNLKDKSLNMITGKETTCIEDHPIICGTEKLWEDFS